MSSTLSDPKLEDVDETLETFLEKNGDHDPIKSNGKELTKDDADDPYLHSCGIGSWHPQWLQRFANPLSFLITMSLVGTIQAMMAPMFFGSMSTLERRYSFDSRVSAVIFIADNFSQMMLSPMIGWLGANYNRARLIGLGEMFIALSCFITALPYFIYGPATHLLANTDLLDLDQIKNNHHLDLCRLNETDSDGSIFNDKNCGTEKYGSTVWPAVIILFFGSACRGVGFTTFFGIGFTYLDDNISKKNSPIYISILQAIRVIGPAFGYLLSAFCLRFYENPFVDPGVELNDPRFIGAWWIGFIVIGVMLFVVTLPMFLFPAEFKNATVKTAEIKKFNESGGSIASFKRIIRNPIIMLYMIGSGLRYIGLGGYVMIKTKYIESQYRQSSSSASLITGTTSIAPMAVGILIGGVMLSVFKPSTRSIFIYVFLVEAVSIFTFGSGMFFGCDSIEMKGLTHPDTGTYSMDSYCNQNCHCTTRVYTPMCGPDGSTTYFSPCYAGCTDFNDATATYSNCSCIFHSTSPISTGFCPKDSTNCHNLLPYLIGILSGAVISSTGRTANSLISLRSVEPMDKSFMMGFLSIFLAIFAFIPYPFIFGLVVESTCLVWEKKCGKTGNCWLYDQEKFRYYFHGMVVLFVSLGSVIDFILIFYSDRVKNFLVDDEDAGKDVEMKNKLKTTNGTVDDSHDD